MKYRENLLLGLITAVVLVFTACSRADVLAGVDFQVGGSSVAPGFTGVTVGAAKSYSTTQNGVTMSFVGTSTGGNANRDRNGAIDAYPLLDDFLQLVGTVNEKPRAAITFSGLTPNTAYTFTFYTHNQGAFQQFHSFYHGTTSGTNLGTFKTTFNPVTTSPNPALAAIPFLLTSDDSGVVLVTMAAEEDRVTINGFSVSSVAPPVDPKITSFASVGSGVWELTLSGAPNTNYEFRSDANLVFAPGTLIENLSPGSTPLGVIGGPDNSILTTDANGLGSVQLTLTGSPRGFVRAQMVPAGQ